MKRQLRRISSVEVPTRLLNTPLMVSEDSVNAILSSLKNGTVPEKEAAYLDGDREAAADGYIAVIPVFGGLAYRGYGWFWRMTYESIRKYFRQALEDSAVKAIVFDIDSPGGEVAGVFDLVDEIYEARGQKPIYAIANEDAFSAAYAIASSADQLYLSRTARVGSIGVIAIHMDRSKYDQDLGVKWTAIYAGRRKNDFNPHEPLRKEAKDWLQNSVNATYELFVSTVARNRKMDPEAIRETEAGIFEGKDAVSAGLADDVLSWEQAMEKIMSQIKTEGAAFMEIKDLKKGLEAFLAQNQSETAAMLSEMGFVAKSSLPETPDVEKIKAEAMEAGKSEGKKEGAQEAIKQACEIVDLCGLADLPQMAGALIKSGESAEEARKKILAEKAKAGGQEIRSTVSSLGTGEVNPLLIDAQKRAGIQK